MASSLVLLFWPLSKSPIVTWETERGKLIDLLLLSLTWLSIVLLLHPFPSLQLWRGEGPTQPIDLVVIIHMTCHAAAVLQSHDLHRLLCCLCPWIVRYSSGRSLQKHFFSMEEEARGDLFQQCTIFEIRSSSRPLQQGTITHSLPSCVTWFPGRWQHGIGPSIWKWWPLPLLYSQSWGAWPGVHGPFPHSKHVCTSPAHTICRAYLGSNTQKACLPAYPPCFTQVSWRDGQFVQLSCPRCGLDLSGTVTTWSTEPLLCTIHQLSYSTTIWILERLCSAATMEASQVGIK